MFIPVALFWYLETMDFNISVKSNLHFNLHNKELYHLMYQLLCSRGSTASYQCLPGCINGL